MDDCANPLWLGWMEEWFETARERNLKTTKMSIAIQTSQSVLDTDGEQLQEGH